MSRVSAGLCKEAEVTCGEGAPSAFSGAESHLYALRVHGGNPTGQFRPPSCLLDSESGPSGQL